MENLENLEDVEMEVEIIVDGETLIVQMMMKRQDDLDDCPEDAIIIVPTLDGNVSMKVPSGTQANKTFRIKGKGMPDLHTGRKGDLFVQVNIEVPTKLTGKQKELIKELDKTR